MKFQQKILGSSSPNKDTVERKTSYSRRKPLLLPPIYTSKTVE